MLVPKLNLDFIENEWIPALRSGEYDQVQGSLRTQNGYCCLGVACELTRERLDIGDWTTSPPDPESSRYDYDTFFGFPVLDSPETGTYIESGYLPTAVAEYLAINLTGLLPSQLVTTLGLPRHTLAHLNDFGLTFDAIADVLEAWVAHEKARLELESAQEDR